MKKRAHIPHNYEMSFEIRQGEVMCLRRRRATVLQKLSRLSHETDDFETHLTADSEMLFFE